VFDWLFEGRPVIYWLLGLLALLLLLVWWRSRKRAFLIAAAVVASLAGVYFLLDKLVETPPEQIERKLTEMATAVRTRDVDAIVKHLAADFHFRGQDKAAFRQAYVEPALQRGLVGELEVWEFHWPEGGDDQKRPVEFYAKLKGGMVPEGPFYLVKAQFIREADGQWRLKGFDLFNPAVDTTRPIDIPPVR
jgi:hypothetical protein